MDPHALVAKRLGERVVLLLGLLGPQHIVEQQLADVPRGQPGQFQAGPVHDDLAELLASEATLKVISVFPSRHDGWRADDGSPSSAGAVSAGAGNLAEVLPAGLEEGVQDDPGEHQDHGLVHDW